MRYQVSFTIAAVCLTAGVATAADKEEIVALCRDGHLQARAAIRQLSCDMEARIPPMRMVSPYTGKLEDRPAEVQRYSWWEDSDVARCVGGTVSGIGVGITSEFLWKEGTLKHLQTVNRKLVNRPNLGDVPPTGRLDGRDGINHVTTVWGYALFFRPEMLREKLSPEHVLSATEEVGGQRRLYKITYEKPGHYREDLFFDPARNYDIDKTILYPRLSDLSVYHINEVSHFTEPKPGIYFPASVKHTVVRKGRAELVDTVRFSNVRVNEAIEPGKLELRFPARTQVTDTRRGKAYTVGDNEEPIGPEEAMGKPHDLADERLMPTALQPPTRWTAIALWMAGGLGVLAAIGFLLVRRRRANRNSSPVQS